MIKQITTKGSWGGARENSGRKKKYVKRITFSATQEVLDVLSKANPTNISDFINDCITEAEGEE